MTGVQTCALPISRASSFVLGALLVGGVAADVAGTLRFRAVGERVRASLEPQFRMFARLDPPTAPDLDPRRFAPRPAHAMQVTRDAVAIDGELVMKLVALGSPRAVDVLFTKLTSVVANPAAATDDVEAKPAARADGGSPLDLSLVVDREVPWSTVLRLLALSHDAGALRIEIMLTHGAPPRIPERGPPEAGYLLARDFVAIPAKLEPIGFEAAPAARFGDVAPKLVAAARAGQTPIAVAVASARAGDAAAGKR